MAKGYVVCAGTDTPLREPSASAAMSFGRQATMAEGLPSVVRRAWAAHDPEALEAMRLYRSHCGGSVPRRVPGMDTVLRLAIRIMNGRTVEEAAAREYLYRWRLALQSPVFGIPHTIGM